MRILLSYSRAHFDPAVVPRDQPFRGSSANILAASLYESLGNLGDVTYVDADEVDTVNGESFDLMVGVLKNFGRILDVAHVQRAILFAVNMHPAERHRILLDFVAQARLPPSALSGWDLPDLDVAHADVARADAIVAVGNIATFNSYVANGIDKRRIRVLNYATADPVPAPAARPNGPVRFVYVASEIGVRKGFDVLEHAVLGAAAAGAAFHLDIVGSPSHPYYEQRLLRFVDSLGERATNHGWLAADSDDYAQVLDGADALLFPSLEEGQAGTVLDALARGVVPVVSSASGIDFSPFGMLETAPTSASNVELVRTICGQGSDALEPLRRKALEYYDELHVGFREPLAEALRNAADGEVWPRASVVLPIFNKEKTIARLLRLLDRALSAYGNVDLHLILDGCSDHTAERVDEFLASQPAYPVKVSVTPDIFEVKTNNIGLRAAEGRYGVIVQDDNLIFDPDFLFEAVNFLERDRRAAVLGGLAGVNFYPRGTQLSGPGQIAMSDEEVYWRQDAITDPSLADRIFQVDACMRGPLIIRKSFMEAHGYLDEAYAPLYQDDMDLCMRATDRGFKVYCVLMDVENDSGTMGAYNADRWAWLEPIMKRNTALFYERWAPSDTKDYIWMWRTRVSSGQRTHGESVRAVALRMRRRWIEARKSWLHVGFLHPVIVRIVRLRDRLRPRD